MSHEEKSGTIEEQIETVPLDLLNLDKENARQHPQSNLDALKASLRKFGQPEPLVVLRKTGMVISGNGRLMAMRDLGWATAEVQWVNWPEDKARAYSLVANRTAELAKWDVPQLTDHVSFLVGTEFEVTDFGFDVGALGQITANGAGDLNDDDALRDAVDYENAPEPPANPETKTGDVWSLGAHRLLCGDCYDRESMARLLAGASAGLFLSDPPYGIKVVKSSMVGAEDFGIAKKGNYRPVHGDDKVLDLGPLLTLAKTSIIWGGNYFADQLPPKGSWLIWDKRCDTGIVNTFADCEMAWSNYGGPARIHRQLWNGMIRQGEHDKREHPTQKPVALMAWCLGFATGGDVLDAFAGAGATLLACEQAGRRCLAVEIDPGYCDVIKTRWEKLTGKTAERVKA